MHKIVTTALDVLGLLVFAAGVGFACAPWIGGAGLIPAGGLILGVSAYWGLRAGGVDGEPS